ncbi:MAG TPA: FAD-dependent oxidoreductase [Polyangiaceae bacterium]|nr:FAD-dependent oxidoreductase [Polyangiaceae bacterium]
MDVIVIGDGPGGLSAALFLAKNGLKVSVYGQDKTAMHFASIRNYLGIPAIHGSEFQKIAREQAQSFGAQLLDQRVESVSQDANGGFNVQLEDGKRATARYLVLSEGKSPRLALQLGLAFDERTGLSVDRNGRTRIDRLYAVGRLTRPERSQAIISAGDGAAVAIDILSSEQGKAVVDWESPA